ncbi:unnamed protein product [Amoebophrya sp. A120]|nr:unnamed protein product [Amoebophrya sp. A120]|eukprot:GSA120T00000247001.1
MSFLGGDSLTPSVPGKTMDENDVATFSVVRMSSRASNEESGVALVEPVPVESKSVRDPATDRDRASLDLANPEMLGFSTEKNVVGGGSVARNLSSTRSSHVAAENERVLSVVTTISTVSASAEEAEKGAGADFPVVRKVSSTRKPTRKDENRIRELKRKFSTVPVRAVLIPVLFVVLLTILRGVGPVCEFSDFQRLASVMGTGVFDPAKVAPGSTIAIPTNFAYAAFHEAGLGLVLSEIALGATLILLQCPSPHSLLLLKTSLVRKRNRRAALAFATIYAVLLGVTMYGGVFACLTDKSRVQSLALFRLLYTPIKAFLGAFLLVFFRYTVARSRSAGCSSAVYRFLVFQFAVLLYIGLALFAVTRIVPGLLAAARELPGYQRIVAEALVCGFFFSILLPLLEKIWGQVFLPRTLPTDSDWSLCGFPDSRVQKAAQDRTRDYVVWCCQFIFDTMRFGMGRGVFLVLSPATIAFVLFRDLTYHVWHFALRQTEALLVFALKVCDFDDLEHVPESWRWITKICYNLQRISSINRRFSIAFDEEIDFEQKLQLPEETTGALFDAGARGGHQQTDEYNSGTASGMTTTTKYYNEAQRSTVREVQQVQLEKKSLALHFSNMRVRIRNVPQHVFRDLCNRDAANLSHGAVEVEMDPEEPVGTTGPESHDGDATLPNLLAIETDGEKLATSGVAAGIEVGTQQVNGSNSRIGCSIGNKANGGKSVGVLPAGETALPVKKTATMPAKPQSPALHHSDSVRKTRSVGAGLAAATATARTAVKFLLGREDRGKTETVKTPVSEAELKAFKHCVDFYRQENFKRYQLRAHCRIMTSLTLMLVPLIALVNNVSLFPGFPQKSEKIIFGLVVSTIFFVSDVVEWYVITWKFAAFDDEQVKVLLPKFVGLFYPDAGTTEEAGFSLQLFPQIFTITQITYCCYFLSMLTTVMYQPYSLSMLREATEQSELTWNHVYEYCGI